MAQGLRPQGDFKAKLLAALAAVALGDALIRGQTGPVGALLLVLPALALITRPALRHDRRAWPWLGLAMAMALDARHSDARPDVPARASTMV